MACGKLTSVTFNKNLGDTQGRASGTGGSGGSNFSGGMGFGGSGRGGVGNSLVNMLVSQIGMRFGIPGIIIAAIVLFFINGGGGIFNSGSDQQSQISASQSGRGLEHCKTFEDANQHDDCRIQATAISLDRFWQDALPQEANIHYTEPGIVIGGGQMRTGCGLADASQTGPFYCPGDETAYFATPFFQQLKQMGGSDGPFAQMYVVAHEIGHHIQHLEGTLGLSDYNQPGADSNAVKIELQADCYAGLWASHADKGPDAVLDPLTQDQVNQAVKSARAIGDDVIQQSSGQHVNPDKWTHGSSKQRVDSFLRGYQGGTMASCKQSFNR